MLAALSYTLTDAILDLLNAPFRYPAVWIPTAFMIGACVGSLLNVCILRLPRGRSLLWPGSTCGSCFQRIHWRDNIPLLSYWLLRGRCRYCGTGFSSLYFWIELLTALAFGGLWVAEVVYNVRSVGTVPKVGYAPMDYTDLALIWVYHVILVSVLIVVVGTTMHDAAVSHNLYRFGMYVGLLGAALGPWPWPVNTSPVSAPTPITFFGRTRGNPGDLVLIPSGSQPWPLWLPTILGLREVPLVCGLLAALAGAYFGRCFGLAIEASAGPANRLRAAENTLLLTMIGTYTGWQAVLLIAILAAALMILGAIGAMFWRGLAKLPFCCYVAIATLAVLLGSGRVSLLVCQLLQLGPYGN